MSTKEYLAIMGCTKDDHKTINVLGGNIYTNLYVDNAGMYLLPPITKVDFKAQLDISVAAETKAEEERGKQDIIDRDEQSAIFYDMMNIELKPYVNKLYRGNKANLAKSGFRVSKEPKPHGLPLPPKCQRAAKGEENSTVKFFLAKLAWPDGQSPEKLTFFVYVSEDPDKMDNLKMVCKTTNSRKLIARNVTRGKDLYYYITAQNAAGESDYSDRIKFMLN